MKNIFMVAVILVGAAACHRATVPAVSHTLRNQEIKNESGQSILIGAADIAAMRQGAYKTWFDESYNKYTVDAATVQQLKPLLAGKRMEIFLGSWCGDSRREVPRMIKTLETAGIDTNKISVVFVDNNQLRYKQSPQHQEKGKHIHRVPSFIIYDGQKEMGRIVESPVVSIEKDMLAIMQQSYQPHYKAVEYWTRNVSNAKAVMPDAELLKLAPALQPLCRHYGELNTYGYVLLAAGENNEALNVFRVNTMIYPSIAGVFDSLAEAYERTGDKRSAITNYEKVLSIEPTNERARNKIAELKKS